MSTNKIKDDAENIVLKDGFLHSIGGKIKKKIS